MDQVPDSLVNGGDCTLHHHSADRYPTHVTLSRLQQLTNQRVISTATYTVASTDDILLIGVVCAVTFPRANNGREIEVVMTGTGNVTVNFAGTDKLYGQTSALLNLQGMALRFKAIVGGWVLL